jgi:hypothetical protein
MNHLHLESTSTTPAVVFGEDRRLMIKGRSIPADVSGFYSPLIEWASGLRTDKILVDINLEYMNSSSSKKLLLLMKALNNNKAIGQMSVIWRYDKDDEDALVNGQVFEKSLPNALFRFLPNAEEKHKPK